MNGNILIFKKVLDGITFDQERMWNKLVKKINRKGLILVMSESERLDVKLIFHGDECFRTSLSEKEIDGHGNPYMYQLLKELGKYLREIKII